VEALDEVLEIILGSDGAGKSELRFLHTIDGSLNPRMVRKRISRSDGKVRALAYFNDNCNLRGRIFVMYCSSIDPS
jgi:hypothetical protein